MLQEDRYPLYGSTFTLYRASPLYHGSEHIFDSLDLHARRLRQHLAGDRARSLLLTDLQPEITGNGGLERCEWSLLGEEDAEVTADGQDNARGLQINLHFERAKYAAYLLGDKTELGATPGFMHLPLMLVRMPAALRELFVDFMSTAFDSRIAPMRLRSSFLSARLEGLLQQTVMTEQEDPGLQMDSLSKGVGLQLAFPAVVPHLKALDILIAKDDLRDFFARGKPLWARYQQVKAREKGPSLESNSNITGPFTAALSAYLSNHTAMELDHPAIVYSKLALGPFALAAEGKVKVLASSPSAVELWEALVTEARGTGLDGVKKTAAGSSVPVREVGGESSPRRSRFPSLPTEPPPPYELHDPARR